MASRVQKIMFWDTFKNAKSVILHFFPVAEIGSNIHLLYFSYPQEILAQFVEWGKKVLSPYRPHWSVYFSVSLLPIAGKHPVSTHILTMPLVDICWRGATWSRSGTGTSSTRSPTGGSPPWRRMWPAASPTSATSNMFTGAVWRIVLEKVPSEGS